MKVRWLCVPILATLTTNVLFAQECPQWGDTAAALKYLQEHKSNSTASDPDCVGRAFATLAHNKASVEVLIGLLDFERSTKHDDFKTYARRYPATGALTMIGVPAVPRLIQAIKESDSELVRTNAAYSLGAIHKACADIAINLLEKEATKMETTNDQQVRLRAAQTYIRNIYGSPCKSNASGL